MISLTNLQVAVGGVNQLASTLYYTYENFIEQVNLFEERNVEEIASKVVNLVEEPNPVKIAIGVPFYWAAEKTAEAGLKVLLAGQGADELFGGYQRYVNDYLLHGEDNVRRN
jgi:asparagine synthetase B (glutamine-hydrolysing)